MSDIRTAWTLLKQAKKEYREVQQALDLIADDARLLRPQSQQRGLDRRYRSALKKAAKKEAQVASELAELLKKFQQWLQSSQRNPQTAGEIRLELQEWLVAFRKRQAGARVQGGQVGAAVRLPPTAPELALVLGRGLDAASHPLLSRLLAVWKSKTQNVDEVMGAFAKENEALRLRYLKLRAANDPAAAEIRRTIVDRARSRFDSTRKQVLKALLKDPALRQDLRAIGLVIERRPNGRTISFQLNLGKPTLPAAEGALGSVPAGSAQDLTVQLDVDHARTDFADAVDSWVATGNPQALNPVVAGPNMRVVTEFENQVFFNILKKDADKWAQPVVGAAKAADAKTVSELLARNLRGIDEVDAEVKRIVGEMEALLGQTLPGAERDAVRDYVAMALEMAEP